MTLRSRPTSRALVFAIACAVPPPAGAAAEEAEIAGIEEIRVSITRRDENLQEVAATISAFTGELVKDLNLEQMADVVALIPNVQIKDAENGAISIRGISQSFTSQSPVAAHLNGIFQFAPATYGDFYDIASIEIQRGPVGVVYGRNATAGAINVDWETPHGEWEAFGDATLGNFDRRQFRGVLNVPLLGEADERLTARFVVQREVSDGKRRNLAGTRNQFGTDTWTFRGTLQARPSEDTVARLRGYWSKNEEGGASVGSPLSVGIPRVSPFRLQQLGDHPFDPYDGLVQFQQSLLNPPPGATPFYVALVATCWPVVTAGCPDPGISSQAEALQHFLLNGSAPFGLPALIRDPQYFQAVDLPRNTESVFSSNAWETRDPENEVYFVDFDIEHTMRDVGRLGDVSVTLAGGFYRQKEAFFSEVDGTVLEIINNFRLDDVENWVAELRIASANDGPVHWTLGLFWFDRELARDDFTRVPFVQTGNLTDIEESGYAPFANLTVRPLALWGADDVADVEIFLGIRKNRDIFSDKTNALPTLLTPVGGIRESGDVFRELTYELGFRWFVSEHQTLYVKYSKGYKAGRTEFDTSIDLSSTTSGLELNSVKEEIVRAWEAGWKSTWLDGRLQTAWSAFYYSYADLQVPKIQGFQVLTQNAANATNWGVEFEARYRPTAPWLIQFAGGYLNATFDAFCAQDDLDPRSPAATDPACLAQLDPGASGPLQDLSGKTLEDSPRIKMSLITSYEWDLGEYGTLRPVLAFTWTDEYFRRPFNTDAFDRVDSFTRTDLRLFWTSADERFTVEVFGENLEDDRYFGRNHHGAVPVRGLRFRTDRGARLRRALRLPLAQLTLRGRVPDRRGPGALLLDRAHLRRVTRSRALFALEPDALPGGMTTGRVLEHPRVVDGAPCGVEVRVLPRTAEERRARPLDCARGRVDPCTVRPSRHVDDLLMEASLSVDPALDDLDALEEVSRDFGRSGGRARRRRRRSVAPPRRAGTEGPPPSEHRARPPRPAGREPCTTLPGGPTPRRSAAGSSVHSSRRPRGAAWRRRSTGASSPRHTRRRDPRARSRCCPSRRLAR